MTTTLTQTPNGPVKKRDGIRVANTYNFFDPITVRLEDVQAHIEVSWPAGFSGLPPKVLKRIAHSLLAEAFDQADAELLDRINESETLP